jgi:O-antigen ligase
MKELLPVNDSLTNKISFYHLLFLLASLPFDRFYSHVILISFAVHTLINFDKKLIRPLFNMRALILVSVFLVTVLSTIYSINKQEAFNEWGKQITILLFPIIFCFNPLDIKKYINPLLLGFSMVCTATVTYLYFDAFHTIRHYQLPLNYIFSSAFVNHNFSEPIDMHATFLSMQLAIALVYLIAVILKERLLYYKLFYIVCAFILLAGLIQLCSKSVYFCVFVLINIVVPYFLLGGAKRWRFMAITAFISIVSLTGIFRSNIFKERYITDFRADLTKATPGEVIDSRWARWVAVTELIVKSPVIGYGAGSEVGLLQGKFFEKKFYNSFLHRLNAHSEYLSFLIKSGTWGLLIYLTTLFTGFKISIKRNDLLFFTFMLLVAVVSFSENLLDVDKGLFFYAFFFSLFMFSVDIDETTLNKSKTVNN